MYIVKDQFGYTIGVCNNFNNAIEVARKFTSEDPYVGKSAYVLEGGVDVFRTTVDEIED
jgi:hypothetical protein